MNNLIDASKNFDKVRDEELDKLFANIPHETEISVDLPSKGRFYKNFSGVKVKPLLFEDEQRILSLKNKNSNIINEILSKCVIGISISEMLEMDRTYLLLKVKEISYGPKYEFPITCPHCGNNTDVSMDLLKAVQVNYITDDLTDPREVVLPKLQVKAKVRFPRVSEEALLNDTDNILTNLNKFVLSINDNDDLIFIAKAIKRMSIMDLKVMAKEIGRKEFGVDTRFVFDCPHCKQSTLLEIPFGPNFFSVTL